MYAFLVWRLQQRHHVWKCHQNCSRHASHITVTQQCRSTYIRINDTCAPCLTADSTQNVIWIKSRLHLHLVRLLLQSARPQWSDITVHTHYMYWTSIHPDVTLLRHVLSPRHVCDNTCQCIELHERTHARTHTHIHTIFFTDKWRVYVCVLFFKPTMGARFVTLLHKKRDFLVLAPNSWSKSLGFESRQEQQKNFSPGSIFCADYYFGIRSTSKVTAVARKRSRSFCLKCRLYKIISYQVKWCA